MTLGGRRGRRWHRRKHRPDGASTAAAGRDHDHARLQGSEKEELWGKNNRVAEMEVTLNGEHTFTATIPDEKFAASLSDSGARLLEAGRDREAGDQGSPSRERRRDTCISGGRICERSFPRSRPFKRPGDDSLDRAWPGCGVGAAMGVRGVGRRANLYRGQPRRFVLLAGASTSISRRSARSSISMRTATPPPFSIRMNCATG